MELTEQMLRLLEKDDKSPSGFRIVGYEWRYAGISRHPHLGIYHKVWITDTGRDIACYLKEKVNYLEHDAFELGIKVGEEWVFDGDIRDDHYILYYGEIEVFSGSTGYLASGWFWTKEGHKPLVFLPDSVIYHKIIGNIHENDTDRNQSNNRTLP